jgi:hypothetical protein
MDVMQVTRERQVQGTYVRHHVLFAFRHIISDLAAINYRPSRCRVWHWRVPGLANGAGPRARSTIPVTRALVGS